MRKVELVVQYVIMISTNWWRLHITNRL